jgi:hypothetical protein
MAHRGRCGAANGCWVTATIASGAEGSIHVSLRWDNRTGRPVVLTIRLKSIGPRDPILVRRGPFRTSSGPFNMTRLERLEPEWIFEIPSIIWHMTVEPFGMRRGPFRGDALERVRPRPMFRSDALEFVGPRPIFRATGSLGDTLVSCTIARRGRPPSGPAPASRPRRVSRVSHERGRTDRTTPGPAPAARSRVRRST